MDNIENAAIYNESVTVLYINIVYYAHYWETLSVENIEQLKLRINLMVNKLYNKHIPFDIRQCNLSPYPNEVVVGSYIDESDEIEYFATSGYDLVGELPHYHRDILGIFADIPISFMIQNKNDITQARFIRIEQYNGNIHIDIDVSRWRDDIMEYDYDYGKEYKEMDCDKVLDDVSSALVAVNV